MLDALTRGGVKALDSAEDWQTRKVDASPITPSFGMHKNSGSPSGTVQAKLGANEAPLPSDPNK